MWGVMGDGGEWLGMCWGQGGRARCCWVGGKQWQGGGPNGVEQAGGHKQRCSPAVAGAAAAADCASKLT